VEPLKPQPLAAVVIVRSPLPSTGVVLSTMKAAYLVMRTLNLQSTHLTSPISGRMRKTKMMKRTTRMNDPLHVSPCLRVLDQSSNLNHEKHNAKHLKKLHVQIEYNEKSLFHPFHDLLKLRSRSELSLISK
jgi:hypothetical protein